jgi:hypothetical protein
MSTNAELVAFVRDITDLDEVDLPTSLIRSYMRDGFNRIINLERRWPFYEVQTTLNTVANQRDYPVSSLAGNTFREVTSILDNSAVGNKLAIIALDEAESVWHGSFDTPTRPLFYAEWGETIKLYPKPDTVYPLIIRGYRKPTYGWVTDPDLEPDLDYRFHDAIAYYAVSQAYRRQEDNEMAGVYKQSFDEAVFLARKEVMRPSSHRPMIMSRGTVRPSYKYWLESMGRNLGQ